MRLIWKPAIPQIIIVLYLGLVSFFVIDASFISMREHYVKDVIENRFQVIAKAIEVSAEKSISETSPLIRYE